MEILRIKIIKVIKAVNAFVASRPSRRTRNYGGEWELNRIIESNRVSEAVALTTEPVSHYDPGPIVILQILFII